MKPRAWQVSRRAVLRGLGATLALPFLDAMIPPAGAAGGPAAAPPVRFGLWYYQHGSLAEYWVPPEPGPIAKLPPLLRAVEFARAKTTIVSNLTNSGYVDGRLARGGHQQELHLFTGGSLANLSGGGVPTASVSIDHYIAQRVGHQTPVESLRLMEAGYSKTFWRDATTPAFGENSPRLVFDRMFRRGTDRPGASEASLLDSVLDQTAALKNRVGRRDRRQLDDYLESVRATEARLKLVEGRQRELEADRGARAADLAVPGLPDTPRYTFDDTDRDQVEQYLKLMSDLLVLAYRTDTTRVGTFHMGNFGSFPDVVTVGTEFDYHALAHSGASYSPERADPVNREAFREVQQWFGKNLAYLIGRLDAIEEPNGTLLDNCLIVHASDLAAGDHSVENIPMVLLGRGGGILKGGRHVACEPFTPVANLYVELLNRMGLPTAEFGDSRTHPEAKHGGRLPALT